MLAIHATKVVWRAKTLRSRSRQDAVPARGTGRKPPQDPESPIAGARRRRGRERPEQRLRGSRRRRCLLVRFRQPWRDSGLAGYRPGPGGAASARAVIERNLVPGGRRRERRECVLCDEYAYITAKRGRRRIGFTGSAAEIRPGAREFARRSFSRRGLASKAWPIRLGQ